MEVKFRTKPPVYDNVDDLRAAIEDYFENGVTEKSVLVGKGENQKIEYVKIPTITGLALHLGFASRQSFYDYEKKKEYSYTLKQSRSFIEKHYEELLQAGNTQGAIFALKNFGWVDRKEIGVDEKTSPNIDRIEERLEELETKSSLHSKKLN